MRPLVIVPTYNESENILPLVRLILKTVPEAHVLVVDDTSPDGTAQIVEQLAQEDSRVHLLLKAKKEGLAAAYGAGFRWAESQPFDVWIEMDADFSHDPQVLVTFLEKLKTQDAVFGCRYMAGGGTEGWSLWRRFVSRLGNIYAQVVLQLPYRDLTGGFNAWKRKVIEEIRFETILSKGYAFQVELKYRAHRLGFSLVEVPIHFVNRRYGKSKISGNIITEAALRVLQLRFAGLP